MESDLNPLSPTRPLDIRDGYIHYFLYGQDGKQLPVKCLDTQSNRSFVVWTRKYDRQ